MKCLYSPHWQARLTAGGQSDSFSAPHAIQCSSLWTMQHGGESESEREKQCEREKEGDNNVIIMKSVSFLFLTED